MSTDKSKQNDLENIDLIKIVRCLLTEKKIFFLLISVSLILSFFLYTSHNKLLKTEAVINSPPFYIFEAYKIADRSYPYKLRENFFKDLQKNIISSQNLNNFYKKNSKNYIKTDQGLENFKIKIYQEEVDNVKEYVRDLIFERNYTYKLDFQEGIDGVRLLNDYLEYSSQENIKNYVTNVSETLATSMKLLQSELAIAEEINLTEPFLILNKESNIVEMPKDLFYNGSIVLKKRIKILENLKSNLEASVFDYDIFSDKAGNLIQISKNIYYFLAVGLLFGIVLSTFVVLFKLKLSKKKY